MRINGAWLLAGLLLLCSCADTAGRASVSGTVAPPGTRTIHIHAAHTNERVAGTYAHDGHYDAALLEQLAKLFRDRTTGEVHAIDPRLIEVIYNLLSALALPETTEVELTSGFRSPGRQAELAQRNENFARRSLHTTGQAADLKIPGILNGRGGSAIGEIAKTLQGGGVAYYPKTGHIHVDTGAVRTWTPK